MKSGQRLVVAAVSVMLMAILALVLWIANGDDGALAPAGDAPATARTDVESGALPSAEWAGRDDHTGVDRERLSAVPLPEQPQRLQLASGVASVTVRAVDGDGAPIPGLMVGWRDVAASARKLPGMEIDEKWVPESQRLPESVMLHLARWWEPARGVTDAQGELTVTGIPAGTWSFAVGRLPEWGFHSSEPVVCDGQFTTDVTITLTRLPADRVIAGRIIDSIGQPLRFGEVIYYWTTAGGLARALSGACHGDGSFALLPPAGVRGDLQVVPSAAKHRSKTLRGVAAGSSGLVVRLQPPVFLEMRVENSKGVPQDEFAVRFDCWLDERWVPAQDAPRKRSDEPLLWRLPTVPFRVSVVGAEPVGPVSPDDVDSVLTVHLLPQRLVTGRVVSDGLPVSGARVRFLIDKPVDPEQEWFAQATQSRTPELETEDDGTFSLTLRQSGTYQIEGWEDHAGRGVVGPLAIPDEGLSGLQIDLTEQPAAIWGRVSLPEGHSPEEVWLSVSTLPGYTTLFPDGRYRLSAVPPGPCAVIVRAGYPLPNTRGGERFEITRGPRDGPSWSRSVERYPVNVAPGEERRLDIDLGAVAPCRLVGSCAFGERAEGPALVWLERDGESGVVSQAVLSADGAFELGALEPGRYRLQLFSELAGGLILQLYHRVDLGLGEIAWRFSPEWGALRVSPSTTPGQLMSVVGCNLRWDRSDGLVALLLSSDCDYETGSCTWGSVPAGRVSLIKDGQTPERAEAFIEVPPGRMTEFRLP